MDGTKRTALCCPCCSLLFCWGNGHTELRPKGGVKKLQTADWSVGTTKVVSFDCALSLVLFFLQSFNLYVFFLNVHIKVWLQVLESSTSYVKKKTKKQKKQNMAPTLHSVFKLLFSHAQKLTPPPLSQWKRKLIWSSGAVTRSYARVQIVLYWKYFEEHSSSFRNLCHNNLKIPVSTGNNKL